MTGLDPTAILRPDARLAFELFCAQRSIVRGFYDRLSDRDFDFRLTDEPDRRSDSPRESLTHVVATQRAYLEAMERGTLDFSRGNDGLDGLGRRQLLTELDAADARLHGLLAAEDFDPYTEVTAPWGTMRAIDMVFTMRDHEILHVSWNLALMDALGIERFDALRRYWG